MCLSGAAFLPRVLGPLCPELVASFLKLCKIYFDTHGYSMFDAYFYAKLFHVHDFFIECIVPSSMYQRGLGLDTFFNYLIFTYLVLLVEDCLMLPFVLCFCSFCSMKIAFFEKARKFVIS